MYKHIVEEIPAVIEKADLGIVSFRSITLSPIANHRESSPWTGWKPHFAYGPLHGRYALAGKI
jgi:hypothetical protein